MNNPFSRIPGLSLAQGLQAGFQAAGSGLQNQALINKLSEDRKNEVIRNLQREASKDQLITENQLNAASNQTLLGIQKLRPQLYSSPDGYLQALNQISPVGQGFTRRLSSDGKTVETVNPLGAVVGTTPNYSGKAAENALLNAGGISLAARAQQLPQQEEADAKNQTALMVAKMHGDAQRDVALYGLKAARAAAGAGRGKGLGPDSAPKLNAEEYKKLHQELIRQFDARNGFKLPWAKDGSVDMSTLQGNADAGALYADYSRRADAALMQSAQYGVQPALAAMGSLAQFDRDLGASNAKAAELAAAEKAKQDAERQAKMNQPVQPMFQNTNPYSVEAPMQINPAIVQGLQNLVPKPVVPQAPSQDFINRYGNVYLD